MTLGSHCYLPGLQTKITVLPSAAPNVKVTKEGLAHQASRGRLCTGQLSSALVLSGDLNYRRGGCYQGPAAEGTEVHAAWASGEHGTLGDLLSCFCLEMEPK